MATEKQIEHNRAIAAKGGKARAAMPGFADHNRSIARSGGLALVEKRGREYMAEIGARGLQALADNLGTDRTGALEWLVAQGLMAQDPFPENGAWQNYQAKIG